MRRFVPGLELNACFYAEAVEPVVRRWPHAASLLGWGSDVLGYDTERSTDHGWGPRLQVFVAERDVEAVRRTLEEHLPATFRGWPTRYGWDEVAPGHHVEVRELGGWLIEQLGFDPRARVDTIDWLTVPQQKLIGVVAGAVYADPDGELGRARERLRWYPEDVWRWLLASQWARLGQEEPFVGRTAEVGDGLGSQIVAVRLARELMSLAFLVERRYRPYVKWFGTAFGELALAPELLPALEPAVAATDFAVREQGLVGAFERLARAHNALGLTEPLDPDVRGFHDRPFRVLASERFAAACRASITDPWLRALPLAGSVDQFVDSTDILSATDRARHLRTFYRSFG